MSIQYRDKDFAKSAPLLVLNEPRWPRPPRRIGLGHSVFAGILAHCRMALRHARANEFPVAFISNGPRSGRWMAQLEPRNTDMLFERRAASIYSCPYFRDATQRMRKIVFAGFFRNGGCAATLVDGLTAGHDLLFLRDAIEMSEEEQGFWFSMLSQPENAPQLAARAGTTTQWIAATGPHVRTDRPQIAEERGET